MENQLKPQLVHQHQQQAVRLSLILKTAASMKKWTKFAQRSRDRHNRLNQLVTTEQMYLRDLIMLKQKVKQELLNAKIINAQQSNEMFPNIEGMIDLSQQIHLALKEKLTTWNSKATLIADTMCKFSRFFIIYSDFFKNLYQTLQKLKKILATNEQARSIQKKLSLPNRIITIQDLISKPFQRPLKYHLILRDYFGKTDPSHPDYANLQKAIELYHRVNEQNNLSVQNKQKSQTLVNLQSKFGNIISEARHYIAQYDAVCFQTPVLIYLFSNLAILVLKKHSNKELVRISFNKFSHVQIAEDVLVFKNRLYFYGQKVCAHLVFADKLLRDDFYNCLRKLIEQMCQNQTTRETIITERISRSSLGNLKRKFSFTNLEPQLQRPIVASVIGTEERTNKSNQTKSYFAIEFFPQRQNLGIAFTPHHISILNQDVIFKLEKLISHLYPDELLCLPISNVPRHVVLDIEYYKNAQKKTEIRTILLTLFLNSLFRSPIIIKRIDIVLYYLQISESIWSMLKASNSHICLCKACLDRSSKYCNHGDYNKQICQREYNKINEKKAQYCEIRTITSQQIFSQVFPELMLNAKSQDKIAWCKSRLGWINQKLTNTRPSSKFAPSLKLKIYSRGFPNTLQFQINCFPNDPVRKVISMIEQRRQVNLQDYVLVVEINKNYVVLYDEQPIGSFFRQNVNQQRVFDKISNFFSKKQELKVNFYLQKYWVAFCPQDYVAPDRSRRIKVNNEVQSIMVRLQSSQLKLGQEETLQLYSLFLCKKYFSQYKSFDYQKIASKIRNRQQMRFPTKLHNESNISRLYQKVQKIKEDIHLKSDFDIGVKILRIVSEKLGWSCMMFEAQQELANEKMDVKIGCDLRGVHVRQHSKLVSYLQFLLEDDSWTHHTSGNIFMITDNQKTFRFIGREVWKIEKQIQFYKTYLQSFGRYDSNLKTLIGQK